MTTATIEMEQKQTLEQDVLPLIQRTLSLTVKTQEQKTLLVVDIRRAEDLRERIEDRFHPTENKDKARKVYEALLDTEKQFYGPIDVFTKAAKGAVKAFETSEALRIQRETAEAEAKRQEEERGEREKLEAQAKKAEEKGKVEKAEALREAAQTVQVMPKFTPPPQPVKKLIWKARVTNLFALCKAIASGQVPFSVVEVRLSALNDFAKNYDGKAKVPGVEFYQETNGRI